MNIAILDYDNTLSDGYSRYKLGYAMEEAGLIQPGLKEQIEDLENRYLSGQIDYNEKFAEDKIIFSDYNDGLKRLDAVRFLENDFDLEASLHPWAKDLIYMLNDASFITVVISGAWGYIMEYAQYFLDFDSFFATEIEVNKEKFTSGYKSIMDIDTKREVAQKLLEGSTSSLGIGDSIADFSFLQLVDKGILYEPKPDALEASKEKGFTISNQKTILKDVEKIISELI